MMNLELFINFVLENFKKVMVTIITFAAILVIVSIDSMVDKTPFWVWLLVSALLWAVFGYLEYRANALPLIEEAEYESVALPMAFEVRHPVRSSTPVFDQTLDEADYEAFEDLLR